MPASDPAPMCDDGTNAASVMEGDLPDASADDSPACFRTVRVGVSSLRPGMRLSRDIFDDRGILLLRAGVCITPRFLAILDKHNVRWVQTAMPAAPEARERIRRCYTEQLDNLLTAELSRPVSFEPVDAVARPRLAFDHLQDQARRGAELHARSSDELGNLFASIRRNPGAVSTELQGTVDCFVDMLSLDFDLLPTIVGMQRNPDEYLFDHCVSVSLVAMAIGAQLGLPRERVMEIGLGALLQDIGMLTVPDEIRLAPRPVTVDERLEIQRHPVHTMDLLEGIPSISARVKLIAYQAHERGDGSGYPRHRSGRQIHPYARIVAIADAYTAMTRPRPHRQPLLPYETMRLLLQQGSQNMFDRVVLRALLDCTSLFPTGSHVELNNGLRAKVIRANPGRHTFPVVTPLDRQGGNSGETIDLSQEPKLRVVAAVPAPACEKA